MKKTSSPSFGRSDPLPVPITLKVSARGEGYDIRQEKIRPGIPKSLNDGAAVTGSDVITAQ